MANALGNILKLSSGPDKFNVLISTCSLLQKCPKYMKTFRAHNNPHEMILKGIIYKPAKCFYLFGFRLDKFTIVDTPTET